MQTIHDKRYRSVIARLRVARHDSGLTQTQVAHALGWHRTLLSNIETCERRIDILETYMLCRIYELSDDSSLKIKLKKRSLLSACWA